jgi:hypothetical protein
MTTMKNEEPWEASTLGDGVGFFHFSLSLLPKAPSNLLSQELLHGESEGEMRECPVSSNHNSFPNHYKFCPYCGTKLMRDGFLKKITLIQMRSSYFTVDECQFDRISPLLGSMCVCLDLLRV